MWGGEDVVDPDGLSPGYRTEGGKRCAGAWGLQIAEVGEDLRVLGLGNAGVVGAEEACGGGEAALVDEATDGVAEVPMGCGQVVDLVVDGPRDVREREEATDGASGAAGLEGRGEAHLTDEEEGEDGGLRGVVEERRRWALRAGLESLGHAPPDGFAGDWEAG